jgi:hypothetical protein
MRSHLDLWLIGRQPTIGTGCDVFRGHDETGRFRLHPHIGLDSIENPLLGGVARSAGVGFRTSNPHQVVGHGPKTLKSPLVQGGTLFSSNVAPPGGKGKLV